MNNTKKIFITSLAILIIGIGTIGFTACDIDAVNSDVASQEESLQDETSLMKCEHNYMIDDAVEANCEKVGLTAGAHCSLCGTVFIKQERVDALGHAFEEYVSNNNATCEKNGTETATCTRLGCTKTNTREEVNSKLTHAISKDWSYDMEYHWHGSVCGCEEKKDYEKHRLVGLECSVCGNTLTPTEGVVYEVSEEGTYAEVVGYTGTESVVIISETYDNIPVTHIGEEAFGLLTGFTEMITSVVIPNSVTHIGRCAFIGQGLKEVIIPSSVTNIGTQAFAYCYNLENIVVGVKNEQYCSIDGNLYNADMTQLLQYAIGKKDTSFVIPNGVTSIGLAFYGSENLKELVIPDSLNLLRGEFSGCYNLINIKVYNDSQKYCSVDGNLYNAEKTELIQYAVGKQDTSFTVLEGVTTIGIGAFVDCEFLTEIILPNSLEEIGVAAFNGCDNLTEIIIPSGVSSIGYQAFADCRNLENIIVDDGNEYYCAVNGNLYDCDKTRLIQYANGKKDTSFTILEGVTSIEVSAFTGSSRLVEVVIPKSVMWIGDMAFAGCWNLTSVIFENAESWNVNNGAGYDDVVIKGEISKGDLLVPTIVATYLTSTYVNCTWECIK